MIYFVRHGETDANRKNIIQGQLDIPLNTKGIEQAHQAKDNLSNVDIGAIYSSPLVRAFKTASIINEKHNLKIIKDDRLKELDVGDAQGECVPDWSEEKRKRFFSNPKEFKGESWEEFYNRVIDFFKEIENSNENILIVSHGGVFRNIYRYIYEIEDIHYNLETIKNAKIIKIDTINKTIDLN